MIPNSFLFVCLFVVVEIRVCGFPSVGIKEIICHYQLVF